MRKSQDVSREELKARMSTFAKALKHAPGIWDRVEPVGHAVALHDGYTIELSIVRYKQTPDYYVMLSASRGEGEEPLTTMDLDFALDWVADSEQVTQEVAAGVAQRPGIIQNLIEDAIYAETMLLVNAVEAAGGSMLPN